MGVAAIGMVLFNRNLSGLRFRPRAVEIQQVGQSCLKNVKISPIDILHGIASEPHSARLVVLVVLLWCSCGVPALSN
jgi:hypothetical protein